MHCINCGCTDVTTSGIQHVTMLSVFLMKVIKMFKNRHGVYESTGKEEQVACNPYKQVVCPRCGGHIFED